MRRAIVACLALAWTSAAHAYSEDGHKAIAALAWSRLRPETRRVLTALLAPQSITDVAAWLDWVRAPSRYSEQLKADTDWRTFVRDFPDSDRWHYVNLPLRTTSYAAARRFQRPDDIVQVIGRSVGVLEWRDVGAPRLTKRQALRVLVHLVGDIHQPVHVGCGYYRLEGPTNRPTLLAEPDEVTNLARHDRGANGVVIGAADSANLHAYWDSNLTNAVGPGQGWERLAGALAASAGSRRFGTSGRHTSWAARWASASAQAARMAYSGIAIPRDASLREDGSVRLRADLPKDYLSANRPLAESQLVLAGSHLANLLNAIRWKP